jgi:hypothetical protein
MPTIWKRRVALMAAVGFLVAIPVWLAIRDDDDEPGPAVESPPTTATTAEPKVGEGRNDSGLGVRYRLPKGWRDKKEASAIRLTSRDRSAHIVIAAPAPVSEADEVLDDAIVAFRRNYEDVKVAPGSGRKIGGRKAKGAVITASTGDASLRAIVAVATGKENAYLVEIFTGADTAGKTLREAQVALNSLRLTR